MVITENSPFVELVLSPEGRLYLDTGTGEPFSLPEIEKIRTLFAQESGLLHLGIQEFASPLPASLLFWQKFARQFITQVCKITSVADTKELTDIPPPEN